MAEGKLAGGALKEMVANRFSTNAEQERAPTEIGPAVVGDGGEYGGGTASMAFDLDVAERLYIQSELWWQHRNYTWSEIGR